MASETRAVEPRVTESNRTVVVSASASSSREGTYSLAETGSSQQPAPSSAGSGSFFARLFGRSEEKKLAQYGRHEKVLAFIAEIAGPAQARAERCVCRAKVL